MNLKVTLSLRRFQWAQQFEHAGRDEGVTRHDIMLAGESAFRSVRTCAIAEATLIDSDDDDSDSRTLGSPIDPKKACWTAQKADVSPRILISTNRRNTRVRVLCMCAWWLSTIRYGIICESGGLPCHIATSAWTRGPLQPILS